MEAGLSYAVGQHRARSPSLPLPPLMYSRGLFKHTHSLTAFWRLPFEDVAVIGPRGGGKREDWRWAAVFKEDRVAWRGGCNQSKELKERSPPPSAQALL